MDKDVVCGMETDPRKWAGHSEYQGGLPIVDECKATDAGEAPASTLVTIAGSAGAFQELRRLASMLPRDLKGAVAIALHTGPGSALASTLRLRSRMPVRQVQSGDMLRDACIYVPPPCTHLIVHPGGRVTASDAAPVRRFRPSADWLFESAAASFLDRHMAVVVSGNLTDGSRRLDAVKRAGGTVLAQTPADAEYSGMPAAAIATGLVDQVLPIDGLAHAICEFVERCASLSPAEQHA